MEVKDVKKIKPKKEKIIKVKKEDIVKPGTLARFFGVNPNEIDGMVYQKQVRNEW